jgi:hypothetical protein
MTTLASTRFSAFESLLPPINLSSVLEPAEEMVKAKKDFDAARRHPNTKLRVNETCKVYSDIERIAYELATGQRPPDAT